MQMHGSFQKSQKQAQRSLIYARDILLMTCLQDFQASSKRITLSSLPLSFILRAGTTTELAKERMKTFYRFWKLVGMIKIIPI